ncbi:MAG: hypothetical protein ACYCYF_08855 [Anaerolineae bacterium]
MYTVRHRSQTRFIRPGLTLLLAMMLSLAGLPARLAGAVDVFWVDWPGSGAPPTALGPFKMEPFPADTRLAQHTMYTSVPGPSGDLLFSKEGMHIQLDVDVPADLFGHGYSGSVYFFPSEVAAITAAKGDGLDAWDTLEITLPANTMAFYMYVDSNNNSSCETVVAAGSASSGPVVLNIDEDAPFFGFYSTGAPLDSVIVTAQARCDGVAIGDFGIHQRGALSPRADVGVVIYGGWGGMPVQAWVGGTAQPTLYTAPNHEGEAAALFTFWPPENTSWQVSVAPEMPAYLDPALWELKLVGIRRGTTWGEAPASGDLTIARGSQIVLYYQLLSKASG